MRSFAIVLVFLASTAQAKTYYFVDGKPASAGQAKIAAIKNPNAVVESIEVKSLMLSETSGNLKKKDDLLPKRAQELLNTLK